VTKWNPGDVVRLKTGGWPMTVEGYGKEYDACPDNGTTQTPPRVTTHVNCVWFEKRPAYLSMAVAQSDTSFVWDGPKYGCFHEDALVATEERTV
jgi:uncharacterized protein YodC (DUF2158 family)